MVGILATRCGRGRRLLRRGPDWCRPSARRPQPCRRQPPPRMPPHSPRFTRSPCKSEALACASGPGQSRVAKRCGHRCRSRRLQGESFAFSLASKSNLCSCSTYAVWLGRKSAKPFLPRSLCFLSWSRRSSTSSDSSRSSAWQAAAHRCARARWPFAALCSLRGELRFASLLLRQAGCCALLQHG
eukprot:6172851-Pleurochrysis_carterae.AAC.6